MFIWNPAPGAKYFLSFLTERLLDAGAYLIFWKLKNFTIVFFLFFCVQVYGANTLLSR